MCIYVMSWVPLFILSKCSRGFKFGDSQSHKDSHALIPEAVVRGCSVKKLFFEAYNFIKKDTLTQVFSYEFCEISKNNFFYRTPLLSSPVILTN